MIQDYITVKQRWKQSPTQYAATTLSSDTYSQPLGTYSGKGTKVQVVRNADTDELEIYDMDDELITSHKVSPIKGTLSLYTASSPPKWRNVRFF